MGLKNMFKCPGQDQRFWKPDDIFEVKCPGCGDKVEFFKDEPKVKCRKCRKTVLNPKIDLGCAQWCQYAQQCLGLSNVDSLNVIRNRLIEEMKNTFGQDQKRIDHALSVLDYTEQIQKRERGNPLIVKAAAILHDIGIHEAERKYGSSEARYQEKEGPTVASKILQRQGITGEHQEHICRIIANHHSAKDIDTTEFRIVWDADNIVNLLKRLSDADKTKAQKVPEKIFKTETGRKIAIEKLSKCIEKED